MKHFLNKYWPEVLGGLIAFFSPISSLLLATGILVLCDMITGVFKARKLQQPILSKKMGATVTKTILYFIAIILAHLMETQFYHGDNISKTVAGIIALIEFKSNMENISVVTGIDFVSMLKEYIDKKRATKDESN